ncbi:MAG: GTP 3',8-cyclase MoaA [Candidatus Hydrogenedentes bacterium]|nr:GTP 3',8-cyclase MoaA [Candidatus Hydrogenedentota bacterium]
MAHVRDKHTHYESDADSSAGGEPVQDRLARPIRDLRISVTDKCNFRCPYCMPADRYGEGYPFLTRQDLLSFEEIVQLARAFARSGVRKLRLTGGEPLLRRDLSLLVEMLAGIDGIEDLALTTNGMLLKQHAVALRRAGLHRVTVSLDSLDDTAFAAMNGGRGSLGEVLDGIAAAAAAGLDPIKINVVVKRGVNDHTAAGLAEHFRGTGHIVRFIEYMDVGTLNDWRRTEVVPSAEVLGRIAEKFPVEPVDRDYPGEVAERYRYVDGAGEIGFISSVTAPFCGGCTRARLSADGKLFLCLFAKEGHDLRAPLREGADDGALEAVIRAIWGRRTDRYSEMRKNAGTTRGANQKVEMYHMGG